MLRFCHVFLLTFFVVASCAPANNANEDQSKAVIMLANEAMYKTTNAARRFKTESWLFDLVFKNIALSDVQAFDAKVQYFSKGTLLKEENWTLDFLKGAATPSKNNADDLSLRKVAKEKATLEIDRLTLDVSISNGTETYTRSFDKPLESYTVKTDLIFPIVGPSIITAAGYYDGGHDGWEQLYAHDILGLTDDYSPVNSAFPETDNANMAGWGRSIMAPGDGTIVYVENDILEHVDANTYDEERYKRADGTYATNGNSIVIDHGNGEYSALMHLKTGSVTVAVGDVVKQGDIIAQLGNSGDSYGAHLHYHLQDSPNLFEGNGLPAQFSNLKRSLHRGTFFNPKL